MKVKNDDFAYDFEVDLLRAVAICHYMSPRRWACTTQRRPKCFTKGLQRPLQNDAHDICIFNPPPNCYAAFPALPPAATIEVKVRVLPLCAARALAVRARALAVCAARASQHLLSTLELHFRAPLCGCVTLVCWLWPDSAAVGPQISS